MERVETENPLKVRIRAMLPRHYREEESLLKLKCESEEQECMIVDDDSQQETYKGFKEKLDIVLIIKKVPKTNLERDNMGIAEQVERIIIENLKNVDEDGQSEDEEKMEEKQEKNDAEFEHERDQIRNIQLLEEIKLVSTYINRVIAHNTKATELMSDFEYKVEKNIDSE